MMRWGWFGWAVVMGLSLVACGDDDGMTDASPEPDVLVDAEEDADDDPTPVEVGGEIDSNTTWSADAEILLRESVFVTDNATLTIEAGARILGSEGAALVITRGANIEAVGTADEPIVFTSAEAEGSRASGDWSGLALLGNATLSGGRCENDPDPATDECESPGVLEEQIEGIALTDSRGAYGGRNDENNCGRLEYVRIEFVGAELNPGNELNGLTVAGCGSDTEISYVQVHRGADDGIEFFGGTAGMHHVVISGAEDDSLDWDLGWRGAAQFLVVHQYAGTGDHGFESDNNGRDHDAEPRSMPRIWNATLIGQSDNRGLKLREGTWGGIHNSIVYGFGEEAFDISDTSTSTGWGNGLTIENTVFFGNGDFIEESEAAEMSCIAGCGGDGDCEDDCTDKFGDDDGGFNEAEEIAEAGLGNIFDVDPDFGSLDQSTPDYIPGANGLTGLPRPPAGLSRGATYAGAFDPDSEESWMDGWTSFPSD